MSINFENGKQYDGSSRKSRKSSKSIEIESEKANKHQNRFAATTGQFPTGPVTKMKRGTPIPCATTDFRDDIRWKQRVREATPRAGKEMEERDFYVQCGEQRKRGEEEALEGPAVEEAMP